VHTFHGHVLSGYFSKPKELAFRGIERALATRTDRLVVPSARLRDELLAMRVGRGDQYSVIPLGFELEKFLSIGPAPLRLPGTKASESGPLRAELRIPEDVFLFGIVGRLTAIKNHSLLLEAFANLRSRAPSHLVIVGDGELRPALEADVKHRGLIDRVHFAGWRNDLAPVYRDLDAVVLSSRNEGTPVAIIEAFASSRPVVATAVGGVPDLIDSDSGLLAAPDDAASLGIALDRLLDDPPLRARLAAGGRAKADLFRSTRLLRDLDSLYRSLLA
jgi:glycosyltransferase involved in cell wall biosynthesis